MDNRYRVMSLQFSRYALRELSFTSDVLIKILEALPKGTEIRGWGEQPDNDTYAILISHESFEKIPNGSAIPLVKAEIAKQYTTYEVKLNWPKEYNSETKFEAYLKSIR